MTCTSLVARMRIGIFLALWLLILVLAVGSNEVSGKTITVDDDGDADYVKIQDAIDNSTDGDTVRVYEGYYEESVVVNNSINLIGNGSEYTTIDGGNTSDDVVRIIANWVNMSGFLITRNINYWNYDGIRVESNHTNIFENTCVNNEEGISLHGSKDSTIKNNTFLRKNWRHITLYNCIGCKIENNVCIDSRTGIYLSYSQFCTIKNNTCNDNSDAIELEFTNNCTVTDNICLANYGVGIRLYYSDDSIVVNNTFSANNWIGMSILHSDNCRIENNVCSENYECGIRSLGSRNNKMTNNNCSNNNLGILHLESYNCTLKSNICSSNKDYGIRLWYSQNCRIENNICSGSNNDGIRLWSSDDCSIIDNNCSLNIMYGIFLYSSDHCTIEDNKCSYNEIGLYITHSDDYQINNNDGTIKVIGDNDDDWLIPGFLVIIVVCTIMILGGLHRRKRRSSD